MVMASPAAQAVPVASARSATLFRSQLDTKHLLLELAELIARPRRFLELEVLSVRQHLLLERLHLAGKLLLTHGFKAGVVARLFRGVGIVDAVDEILDALHDAGRRDAVLLVVASLLRAAAIGLGDRPLDRVRHAVGVENRRAVD